MITLITCRGHPNVQASHETTLELSKDTRLTIRGDCIVGVACTLHLARHDYPLRGLAKMVLIAMHPEGVLEFVTIYGKAPANAVFRIESATRLVVRKSKELRDSIMIEASRSSYELPKSIKSMLASPFTKCLSLLIYL